MQKAQKLKNESSTHPFRVFRVFRSFQRKDSFGFSPFVKGKRHQTLFRFEMDR